MNNWFNRSMDYVSTDTNDYDALNSLHQAILENRQNEANFIRQLNKQIEKEQLDSQKELAKRKLELLKTYQKQIIKTEADLSKAETAREKKKYTNRIAKYKEELKEQTKLLELETKIRSAIELKEAKKNAKELRSELAKLSLKEAKELGGTTSDWVKGRIANVTRTLNSVSSSLKNTFDSNIKQIASYQSRINTRLQGTGLTWQGRSGISSRLSGVVGVSPYLQTSKLYENVDTLVSSGVAYNLEQRAFLMTISDKIASTFNAANGTLLQIIRLQQSDSTAARLGMENVLTKYLNSTFQSTEYLNDAFTSVQDAIYEATSQLTASGSIGFEYQVQKWLGSLYSVGMSRSAVSTIASGLGMLGSGNIEGLTGNTALMSLFGLSASRAGMDLGSLIENGITESGVNKLMESMVKYLAEISEQNNLVVRAQYANLLGISVSDLRAASNLASSAAKISKSSLSASGAQSALMSAMGSISSRMSTGELMSNVYENFLYSMAQGVAGSPALYGVWQSANLIDELLGGIPTPVISAMGTFADMGTSLSSLMRLGALGGGILSSAGSLINSLTKGTAGGFNAAGMLNALSEFSSTTVRRGSPITTGGENISESSYTYLANEGSAKDSAFYQSTQEGKLITQQAEEEAEVSAKKIDDHIVNIYELLMDIANGSRSLAVRTADLGSLSR